jgi:hypothetical protein
LWRDRNVEEEGEKKFRLPNIRQLIGEYSAVVEMRRKRRDVVQASQYSATVFTGSLVRGRRGIRGGGGREGVQDT